MGGLGKLGRCFFSSCPWFAERSRQWQRSEFEWLKVGGEPLLIEDVNENFKMMAALRGSNIESWKARANSSSDVQDVGD